MTTMRSPAFRALLFCGAFALPAMLPMALPAPALARPAPDGFADLAARLLPAVVNISSTQSVQANAGGGQGAGPDMPMFPPGSPFEQFFKDFLNRNHPNGQGQQNGQGDDQAPV